MTIFRHIPVIALAVWYSAALSLAQSAAPSPAQSAAQLPEPVADTKPLPDVATLMHAVEAHQKATEAIIKEYIYTSDVTEVEVDGSGKPKKTETTEAEIFYVDGVRLRRILKKNGKELTPDEQKKEKEKIDKEIAKAREKREKGDTKKQDEVTFARFLELGTFSNERRVTLHGRPTIALDFTGDPKAKTRNPLEGAIHELAGTVWVDEEDQALSRVEGHFANNFKIGGGVLVNIAKDTSFQTESNRVNGEVWLPATFEAHGSLRALLFLSFHGHVSGTTSNYRKFKAGATILPGLQEVQDQPATPDPAPTPK